VFSRRTTFFTTLLEAALAVAVSLGVLLVPLTVLWVAENNSTLDWMASYRASADIWLAAHGLPIAITEQTIAGVAAPAFVLQMLPLGFTAIIVGLAFRMGQRLATSAVLWPGWVAGIGVYGAASLMLTTSSKHALAAADANIGVFLPPVLFGAVLILSSVFAKPADLGVTNLPTARERRLVQNWLRERWEGLGWWANVVAPPALRAGTAVVVIMLGFAALTLALLLGFNWIEVIRLYESMQLTLLGGILLTVGQLAFLPNFVVFTADWFTGVGFAIGTGSSVSPLGTNLGPLPSLPIFAALPTHSLSAGILAVLVPVVAAIVATLSVKNHAADLRFEFASPLSAALSLGIPVALVAALEFLFINLLARGALGPGRLADVGGNPLTNAAALFAEVAVVATIAAFYSASPDAPDGHLLERAKASVASVKNIAKPAAKPKADSTDIYDTASTTSAPAVPAAPTVPSASGFEPES
jgi:DNA-binding phage protein